MGCPGCLKLKELQRLLEESELDREEMFARTFDLAEKKRLAELELFYLKRRIKNGIT